MTHEREIERILDTWFADGPTRAPDRVLEVAVGRIDRLRQRPAWRLTWRHQRVNGIKLAAAVAAVVIFVAGGLVVIGRPAGIGAGPPIASPTPTPSPTAPPPPLPQGRLEAGDYVAHALAGDSMAFALTAPEGWQGFGGFFVGGPNASGAPNGIGIAFMHNPAVVDNACAPSASGPSPAPGSHSVDDLIAALEGHDGVQISGLTDATLGGYPGKRLDVQLPTELPCSEYSVFADPQGLYANGPANRWRVWFLDVDGETAVVVLLDYAGTPADDRAAAEGILDSLRISP